MEVQRIRTEGARKSRLRNTSRLVIEVEHATVGMLEGHGLRCEYRERDNGWGKEPVPSKDRLEIYADRLPAVLERCRTDEHWELWKRCEERAEEHRQAWAEENADALRGMSEEQKRLHVYLNCNAGPAQFLPLVGGLKYKTGIPPLHSVAVVHRDDPEQTIDARKYLSLSDEERRAYLLDPPDMPDNQGDRQAQLLADALERAMSRAGGGGSSRSRRKSKTNDDN